MKINNNKLNYAVVLIGVMIVLKGILRNGLNDVTIRLLILGLILGLILRSRSQSKPSKN
tara:strand:- start:391 stop:567 length:177 start_codon:yes stop_codon:yes gene_type:complete